MGKWRSQSDKRNKRGKRPFWIELPILILVAFVLTFLIQTFIAKVYYVPSGSMEKTLHGVTSGGDRILVSKIVYDFRDPHQGDVVVFKGPDTWAPELVGTSGATTWYGKIFESLGSVVGIAPPDEKDFVKRVIAVGGQTVQCCDDQGNVQVDGRSLTEPYLYEPLPFTPGDSSNDCSVSPDGLSYTSRRCFGPFTVPEGQLWVMGDHRSASADSSVYCWGRTAEGMQQYQETNVDGSSCARPIPVDNVIGKAIFIVMPPSRWQTIGDPEIDPGGQAGSVPASAVPITGGLLLTAGLRGGLAMTPRRRRLRKARRASRRAARSSP
ncbi:signal peptidase I [Nakamurella alba]|uniref:signal peptidase I n=1 Tax=Nakamurella alba TaxID=2665158 RepID=UPI00389938A1